MKKLEIITEHPEMDVDELEECLEEGMVHASPHVGNLDQQTNPHYLAIARQGIRLLMVNTIAMDDRSGRPHLFICGDSEKTLFNGSRKQLKSLTPAAAFLEDGNTTVEEHHLQPLEVAGIDAVTMTNAFENIGTSQHLSKGEVLSALLIACDQPVRHFINGQVSRNAEKKVHSSECAIHGIFGTGEDKDSGLALPLTGMMAADIVSAKLEGQEVMHHVGGTDMATYTRNVELMVQVTEIVERAMVELGINGISRCIRYRIIDKNNNLRGVDELSRQLSQETGAVNFSQHDLASVDHGL